MIQSEEVYLSTAVEIAGIISAYSQDGSQSLVLLERVIVELVSAISTNVKSDRNILNKLHEECLKSLIEIRILDSK